MRSPLFLYYTIPSFSCIQYRARTFRSPSLYSDRPEPTGFRTFSDGLTNAMEDFNRQLRKVTKAKSVFPSDDSLLKMLYLAMMDITKKWTGRRQDWSLIHAQMAIYFAERMPE